MYACMYVCVSQAHLDRKCLMIKYEEFQSYKMLYTTIPEGVFHLVVFNSLSILCPY